jgi:hypothetical protein
METHFHALFIHSFPLRHSFNPSFIDYMAMTLMMRLGAAIVLIANNFSAASARSVSAQSAAQGSSSCQSNEFW